MFTPRQSFKTLFCAGDGGSLLKSAALSGTLQPSGVRSIAWIYFLGQFPKGAPSELLEALEHNNRKYKELVQVHIIDPRGSSKELDPTIDNPLSQAADSSWAKYFENADLEKLISIDIERCYPDKDFFKEPTVCELMKRILFVYAKLNPTLSYRQGMHELLAPIVYLLHNERMAGITERDPDDLQIALTQEEEKALARLLDVEHVEADTYFIFSHLLEITGDWFAPLPHPAKGADKKARPTPPDEEVATAIVLKCRRIQNALLKNHDPELHDHLDKLKIEPQFYLLRWVRLLFGREFHLDDLILIWDAVFAHSPDLVLVDYICLAMLIFIRAQLLERDSTGCLTRLMKYPPVEDIRLFIVQAQTLISNRLQQPPPLPIPNTVHPLSEKDKEKAPVPQSHHPLATSASVTPPHQKHNHSNNKKKSKAKSTTAGSSSGAAGGTAAQAGASSAKPLQPWNAAASGSFKHMVHVDTSTTNVGALQNQLQTLRDTQLTVAERLDAIIHTIQTSLISSTNLASADALLLSLAELKQLKDILCGFLPLEPRAREAANNGDGEGNEDDEIDELGVDDTPLGSGFVSAHVVIDD